MADDKKITFSAQDNVTQKANQIYNSLTAQAQKQSSILKEQAGYIAQQIKLLEKKHALEAQNTESYIKRAEKAKAKMGPGPGAMEYNRSINIERAKSIAQQKEGSEVVSILKQLLEQSKKEFGATEKTEKELAREEGRRAKYENLRQGRREVLTNKEAVKKRIQAVEEQGYGNMSIEEIERLNYQRQLVGKKEPESNFKSTLKALLVNDLVKGIAKGISTIVGHPTGYHAFNSLLGGIPFVGGALNTIMSRSFEEQTAVGVGLNKMKAISGNMGIGKAGNVGLGFSSRESLQLQEGMLKAMGTAGGLNTNVGEAQRLEKGVGFSQATLLQMAKAMRITGSTNDLIHIASQVLKSNPDLMKNQTLLEDVTQAQLSLLQTLSTQTENVSQKAVTGLIGGLRGAGGNLANNPDYLQQVAGNLNRGISAPGNDFQKARSFAVLSAMNPGASYLDLLKMQQSGVGQKGYLTNMFKELQKESGGGQNFALELMQNFGLQAGTSEKLANAFAKNPNMFNKFKGKLNEQSVNEILGGGRAQNLTYKTDVMQARGNEAFLAGPIKGGVEMIKQTLEVGAGQIGEAIKQLSAALWNANSAPPQPQPHPH